MIGVLIIAHDTLPDSLVKAVTQLGDAAASISALSARAQAALGPTQGPGSLNLPHAETHAVLLPHTIGYIEEVAPQAVACVAERFGGKADASTIKDLLQRGEPSIHRSQHGVCAD